MADNGETGRRGSIGTEIFEQVERLVNEEGLSRTNAFQRLSDETGRRAGTVAANYYRVARMRGAPLQPRTRKGGGRGRPSARASTDVEGALSRAMESVQELATIVRRQEKELTTLRSQIEQIEKLKSVLSKM